jgi:hypothetical protein
MWMSFLSFLATALGNSINDVHARVQLALAFPDQLTVPVEVGVSPSLAATADSVDDACHKLAKLTALQLKCSVLP